MISRFFIDRPIFASVLSIVITLAGAISVFRLPLAQLSADQKRAIQVLEARGPSADHPVAATCPETNYLKCLICRAGRS